MEGIEQDYVDHFLGKVSLIQLVKQWLKGENRYMTTNKEIRQQAIDMAVKVKTGTVRNTLVYANMTDARKAVQLIMDAGHSVSWVGGNQPALNVTFDVEPQNTGCYACEWNLRTHQHTCEKGRPPVSSTDSVDGNEWHWDDRPYPMGQVYRPWTPEGHTLDVIAISREAVLK